MAKTVDGMIMRRYVRRGGGHVYVAVCDGMLCVKVGFTTEPEARVELLSYRMRADVEFFHLTDKLPDAFKVEKRAHQLLSHASLGGEWFNVSAWKAVDAVRRAEIDVASGWRWPRMACHDVRKGSVNRNSRTP